MKLFKKGSVFDGMTSIGIAIASLVIIFAVMFLITGQVKDNIVDVENIDETNSSTYSVGYNATNTLIDAAATVPGWVPLIVITAIGGLLISLVAVFGRKQ